MDAVPDCTFTRYRLRLEHSPLPPLDGLRHRYLDSLDLAPLVHSILENEPFETLGAVFLDHHRRPTGYIIAYRGTLTRTVFEPRALLAAALLSNSSSLVVFHNHPSGNTRPSLADIQATRRLEAAAEPLGVVVWDHLVLGHPPAFQSVRQFLRRSSRPIPVTKPARKAKPKYRHPETGETWAGRGCMAKWLREELEAGARLEDFMISG
jgi:DNA repair protein RadC